MYDNRKNDLLKGYMVAALMMVCTFFVCRHIIAAHRAQSKSLEDVPVIFTIQPACIVDEDVEVCVHVCEYVDGQRTITFPNAYPFDMQKGSTP